MHAEDFIKQESSGVEESAVLAVECKVEIKEDIDTEDPLSGQGNRNLEVNIFFVITQLQGVFYRTEFSMFRIFPASRTWKERGFWECILAVGEDIRTKIHELKWKTNVVFK